MSDMSRASVFYLYAVWYYICFAVGAGAGAAHLHLLAHCCFCMWVWELGEAVAKTGTSKSIMVFWQSIIGNYKIKKKSLVKSAYTIYKPTQKNPINTQNYYRGLCCKHKKIQGWLKSTQYTHMLELFARHLRFSTSRT
jgi:hypothetical protein